MRRVFFILLASLFCNAAIAEDSQCLKKYKVISDQFYIYNEKSALGNAIMDRIDTYTDGKDVLGIHAADAKAWRVAIEDFIAVAQPLLQNFLEYRAYGCSPNQQAQLTEQINKITEDLKFARARLNALVSGLPASTFR